MNPMDLRRGINLAVDHVLQDLKSRAKMISTTEEIAQACHIGLQQHLHNTLQALLDIQHQELPSCLFSQPYLAGWLS